MLFLTLSLSSQATVFLVAHRDISSSLILGVLSNDRLEPIESKIKKKNIVVLQPIQNPLFPIWSVFFYFESDPTDF